MSSYPIGETWMVTLSFADWRRLMQMCDAPEGTTSHALATLRAEILAQLPDEKVSA